MSNDPISCSVILTKSMWRLFLLVKRCHKFSEPVLLLGETGGGKTTVCQLLSIYLKQHLHILNCHQYTETSDFLGVCSFLASLINFFRSQSSIRIVTHELFNRVFIQFEIDQRSCLNMYVSLNNWSCQWLLFTSLKTLYVYVRNSLLVAWHYFYFVLDVNSPLTSNDIFNCSVFLQISIICPWPLISWIW